MRVCSYYLDDVTHAKLQEAAKAAGVSASALLDWLLRQGTANSLAKLYVTARARELGIVTVEGEVE